ncbi:MAG: VOC family protein [Woeseiaceae bacterium]|nr:VOC family protein [Woeseiaceae bacterium]
MLSHVHIGVSDFDRALTFYTALMDELGYPLKFVDRAKPWAGWMPINAERPLFLIGKPFDGHDAAPGNGQMVALIAPSRERVGRAYDRAIASGGSDEGRPGLRPEYHADYYGAYFRDPDGNKLCVCCHEPE